MLETYFWENQDLKKLRPISEIIFRPVFATSFHENVCVKHPIEYYFIYWKNRFPT
jgi:hypothetical protein